MGIGNDSPCIANPNYTSQQWKINLEIQIPRLQTLIGNNKGGVIYDYHDMTEMDISNNPLFDQAEDAGVTGGISSGLGLARVWDNRDHIFFPNTGAYSRVRTFLYGPGIGSDYSFQKVEIDIRNYKALTPDHVLAYQVYDLFIGGEAPFYQLADIGGSQIMRGYYKGRFRDKQALAARLEYRQYV